MQESGFLKEQLSTKKENLLDPPSNVVQRSFFILINALRGAVKLLIEVRGALPGHPADARSPTACGAVLRAAGEGDAVQGRGEEEGEGAEKGAIAETPSQTNAESVLTTTNNLAHISGNRHLPFFLRQRYLTWETPLSANATS